MTPTLRNSLIAIVILILGAVTAWLNSQVTPDPAPITIVAPIVDPAPAPEPEPAPAADPVVTPAPVSPTEPAPLP